MSRAAPRARRASPWSPRDRPGPSPTDESTLRKLYIDQLPSRCSTPLAVDPERARSRWVANRGIGVAMQLIPEGGGESRNALVAVPQANRLIRMTEGAGRWALSEDVVMAFLDNLFPGYRVTGRCLFRATRGRRPRDRRGPGPGRSTCSPRSSRSCAVATAGTWSASRSSRWRPGHCSSWLLEHDPARARWAVVSVDGPLDLETMRSPAWATASTAPTCATRRMKALPHPAEDWSDPFARIRAGEILLHHPYRELPAHWRRAGRARRQRTPTA